MLNGPGPVFVGERDCQVEEVHVDETSLAPGEVVLDLEVSVISAGTAVANFTGLDPRVRVPGSWNAYPHRPGYGAIGDIVAVGPPSPGPIGTWLRGTACLLFAAMPGTPSQTRPGDR